MHQLMQRQGTPISKKKNCVTGVSWSSFFPLCDEFWLPLGYICEGMLVGSIMCIMCLCSWLVY
jgi:hypothetical protein